MKKKPGSPLLNTIADGLLVAIRAHDSKIGMCEAWIAKGRQSKAIHNELRFRRTQVTKLWHAWNVMRYNKQKWKKMRTANP